MNDNTRMAIQGPLTNFARAWQRLASTIVQLEDLDPEAYAEVMKDCPMAWGSEAPALGEALEEWAKKVANGKLEGGWERLAEEVVLDYGGELLLEEGSLVLRGEDGLVRAHVATGSGSYLLAHVVDPSDSTSVLYGAELMDEDGVDVDDPTLAGARKWCEDRLADLDEERGRMERDER